MGVVTIVAARRRPRGALGQLACSFRDVAASAPWALVVGAVSAGADRRLQGAFMIVAARRRRNKQSARYVTSGSTSAASAPRGRCVCGAAVWALLFAIDPLIVS